MPTVRRSIYFTLIGKGGSTEVEMLAISSDQFISVVQLRILGLRIVRKGGPAERRNVFNNIKLDNSVGKLSILI